jgi:TolB-like protein
MKRLGMIVLLVGGIARAEKAPLRVAVMDFTPATTAAEFQPLGAGLQAMITTDLGELPAFALIERARLKDIQAELKLGDSGMVDKATAAKIGGLAGASHLLVGTFTVVGGKMRIDARLFSVQSGDMLLTEKIEGAQTAFFELEKSLVQKLITSVGVKLSKKDKAEIQKPETIDFEAFQKFSQGLVLFDEKKGPEAVAAMQAAVDRDPTFNLAATRLAEFTRALPSMMPKVEAPKPPSSCRPNPMWAGSCEPQVGPEVPPVELHPMSFGGEGSTPYGVIVRAGTSEARCITPCQLHLPKGPLDLEVVSPVHYTKHLESPGGPATVKVSGRNKTNLIVGSVMTAGVVLMIVTSVALYEAPVSTGATTSVDYAQYGPIPLALGAGMVFPAVYYLLHIGKNDASVIRF